MEDYRMTLNVVGWALASFSTLFVAARLYTRTRISTTEPGWDDWLMLVAWLFAIICTSTVTVGTSYGFGQHIVEIKDPEDKANAAMYVLIAPVFSLTSAFFTKTSIVISFTRIMGRTMTWVHKLVAYVPIVLLLISSMLACGVIIFFCWPVQRSWRPYLDGTCMDPRILDVVGRGVSAYNAAMDIFCAVVPYFLIRQLNIRRKDKRNLIILMGGSLLGAVATIMKIVAMSTISDVTDLPHSWSEITIWYLTENHVLIVAGSMPALRPFWRVIYGKYSSYKSSSYDKDGSTSNKKATGSGSIPLPTIGSARFNARKGPAPGPYTVELRDDTSEESLERGLRRTNPPTKGADTESVELILPHQGTSRARVTGGREDMAESERSERRNSGRKITVTTEVEVV